MCGFRTKAQCCIANSTRPIVDTTRRFARLKVIRIGNRGKYLVSSFVVVGSGKTNCLELLAAPAPSAFARLWRELMLEARSSPSGEWNNWGEGVEGSAVRGYGCVVILPNHVRKIGLLR